MKIRVVLVEPKEAGNVGAVARVMKNFGLRDLAIAGSRPERVGDASVWWAAGADDIVRSARQFERLEDALGDCHMSVATTAARGREAREPLAPPEVAALAAGRLGEAGTLALVFGREASGLTAAEIALCQRTAVIPTDPAFPTMNLAQSVAIFCYELSRGLRPAAAERDPAKLEVVHRLYRQTRVLLDGTPFFSSSDPDSVCAELQAIAGRAALTTREASLLLALVRAVEKRK
jgi:tRNA/rRNA methyltransferase